MSATARPTMSSTPPTSVSPLRVFTADPPLLPIPGSRRPPRKRPALEDHRQQTGAVAGADPLVEGEGRGVLAPYLPLDPLAALRPTLLGDRGHQGAGDPAPPMRRLDEQVREVQT